MFELNNYENGEVTKALNILNSKVRKSKAERAEDRQDLADRVESGMAIDSGVVWLLSGSYGSEYYYWARHKYNNELKATKFNLTRLSRELFAAYARAECNCDSVDIYKALTNIMDQPALAKFNLALQTAVQAEFDEMLEGEAA